MRKWQSRKRGLPGLLIDKAPKETIDRETNCVLRTCWKALKPGEQVTEDIHDRTTQGKMIKLVPGVIIPTE